MSGEWRDIGSAPKDGTAVLTFRRAKLVAVAEWLPEIDRWCVTDGCDIVDVTHWMPLPASPEEEAGK